MTTKEDALEKIDRDNKGQKKLVETAEALARLQTNRDFKRVITEGYLTQEAVRLVHLKGDYNFQTPERQANIQRQIDGIAALVQYLLAVQQTGSMASKAIEANDAMREDILNNVEDGDEA